MTDDILKNISDPHDVKGLAPEERVILCRQIRDLLVQVVSCNGGHLASNLGVVELTVALHTVFNSPQDRIVWDVGHQCYVHKILTGRKDCFASIRRENGISGFPRPDESPHDAFVAGHGSTSLSAALGMAAARQLQGDNSRVVAVIGDGALTGGMAFEALNNAGHFGSNLIIILNDNEMSISRNVGAMSKYLSRLRLDPAYRWIKDEFEQFMQMTPVGSKLLRLSERVKGSVKRLIVPGIIFEELNIAYIGPLDGHDLDMLIPAMESAREMKGPVLIHAVTRKGKGYGPAEANATKFHGAKPFNVSTGEFQQGNGKESFTDVFSRTVTEIAGENSRIVAITAAMTDGTGLEEFARRFPDRFYDVGMAEEHAVTFAAGFAASGLHPVVAIYSTFLQRAYDQIYHDVCLQKLPVIFALDRAGLVGDDGPTHQGVFDLSYLRHLPGMTVMVPRDGRELHDMLLAAVDINGPVALRYPRDVLPSERAAALNATSAGWAHLLRQGGDILMVGVGPSVYAALAAAERLAKKGIEVAVMDARFVQPLDKESLLEAMADCSHVLVFEENVISGGFSSALCELAGDNALTCRFKRLGIAGDVPQHAGRGRLLRGCMLDEEGFYTAAQEFLGR